MTPPVSPDLAVKIVERYFTEPGRGVSGTEWQRDSFVVGVGAIPYAVSRLEERGALRPGPGYELYEVDVGHSDPPARPDGIAVLPDGEMFHLNDEAEFRSFWERVHEAVEPLELAALLAEYQSQGPRHRLIVDEADAAPFLSSERLRDIPDFTTFKVEEKEGGRTIQFSTFWVEGGWATTGQVGVQRWNVEETASDISWKARSIAERLPSDS